MSCIIEMVLQIRRKRMDYLPVHHTAKSKAGSFHNLQKTKLMWIKVFHVKGKIIKLIEENTDLCDLRGRRISFRKTRNSPT